MLQMKTYRNLLLTLILPASIAVAGPGGQGVDPDKLPKVSCDGFRYSEAFLAKYPQAPAACLEGRIKDGVQYAKFETRVYISSPEFMTVELLDPEGNSLSTFSFKPSPDARVLIDGKKVKFDDMQPGEKLTVWVPEGRMEVKALPSPTESSWMVIPPLESE